jgi:hypothetical protein
MSLVKESQNRLFELRQSGSRCHNATSEPQCYPQTEPTAIGNRDKVFNLVDKTLRPLPSPCSA